MTSVSGTIAAADRDPLDGSGNLVTAVMHVGGVHWASEKAVVESFLGRLDGVRHVEANPVAQTATVTYDPTVTSVAALGRWITECGYHCAGQSVPGHTCFPMEEPGSTRDLPGVAHDEGAAHAGHGRMAVMGSPHDAHRDRGGTSRVLDLAARVRRHDVLHDALNEPRPLISWVPLEARGRCFGRLRRCLGACSLS